MTRKDLGRSGRPGEQGSVVVVLGGVGGTSGRGWGCFPSRERHSDLGHFATWTCGGAGKNCQGVVGPAGGNAGKRAYCSIDVGYLAV